MAEIKDIKEKIEIEEVKNDGEEFQFGTLKNQQEQMINITKCYIWKMENQCTPKKK